MSATENSCHLALSGRLSIATVGETHARLQQALSEHRRLTLEIFDITEVDLSLVQVVEAARKSAAWMGGGVSLARPADDRLLTVLTDAGFLTPENEERTAFWTAKGAAQ